MVEAKDCDALCRRFWDHYEGLFPILSKISRIILSASPSSSICERYFSEVTSMLNPTRNRLSAKSIQKISISRHFAEFKESVIQIEPQAELSLESVKIDWLD